MTASEHAQRELLKSLGITVERERKAAGAHKVLYCIGPTGKRFTTTITSSDGCPRTLKNYRSSLLKVMAAVFAFTLLGRAAVLQLDRWELEDEHAVQLAVCGGPTKPYVALRAATPGEGRMLPLDYMVKRTRPGCVRA